MNDPELCDTRSSLLVQLRDLDESAWREFFALYTPAVFRYALRRGLQANDAEDITQEVLVEVARSIKSFEYQPDKGRFRDWLGTIVRRRLARFWNSTQPCSQLLDDTTYTSQDHAQWCDDYQTTVLASAMDNVKHRFAEVTWQIFECVWKNGEPTSTVAQRFGVPIEVVYNAKSRVLKQLEAEVVRISHDCEWLPKN